MGSDPSDEGQQTVGNRSRAGGRGPAWTFPKHPLELAVAIPRVIDEKNAGSPLEPSILARELGYRLPRDWRFRELLRSANQYGLVQGHWSARAVLIQKLGEDVVSPSSSSQRQRALGESFRNVELFRAVEQLYSGRRIPEDEFFENTLVRDFNVPRDRVRKFIEVFTANLKYLNLFAPRKGSASSGEVDTGDGSSSTAEVEAAQPSIPTPVREFLDSCFVMMPFGGWFDRYYQEVYVPAIKAAGLEPVRADALFTTGSVVEQIWEQVQKSTVLLADLSNKNANVFYELGLAHAATKPVVLTARDIDDVPFDLRHLRVITYDVNEPRWCDRLGKLVTDHLKNAKKEPEKSIPQPFRGLLSESDDDDEADDKDEPDVA